MADERATVDGRMARDPFDKPITLEEALDDILRLQNKVDLYLDAIGERNLKINALLAQRNVPRIGSRVELLTANIDRDEHDRERIQAAGSLGVVTMVDADRVHVDIDRGGWLVFDLSEFGTSINLKN
jgi:hypothetical protein